MSIGGSLRGGNLGSDLGSGRLGCGFQNSDNIIKGNLGANDTLGVLGKHDRDLDTDDTLTHEHVSYGGISVDLSGMASLDHVTIAELHAIGTLPTKLTGNDDLNTLGRGIHDETDNTVASTTDSEATEELELEGLGLGLGAETTVLNTLGVKLDGAISEVKTLLDDGGELANTLSLLAKNVLGAGGTDDDLSAVGGSTDLNTCVAILGELASEKLVELRVEDAVSDELPLGGHLGASGLHIGCIMYFNEGWASVATIRKSRGGEKRKKTNHGEKVSAFGQIFSSFLLVCM